MNKKKCPLCAEEILVDAKKCKHCGEMLDQNLKKKSDEINLGTAAVLSFIIPGSGQIYKSQIMEGIFWLIFTVIGYLFFIIPGIVIHIFCIVDAAKIQNSLAIKKSIAQKKNDLPDIISYSVLVLVLAVILVLIISAIINR